MKEKLWDLLVDSILQQNAGAGMIMDKAIKISMELFCEVVGIEFETLDEAIAQCQNEAYELIDYQATKQRAVIELLEFKLMKLKIKVDNGELKKGE